MKLKLPAGEFHAYLFDCDGTVVESMPLRHIFQYPIHSISKS